MQKRTVPAPSLAPKPSKKPGLHRLNNRLIDEIAARVYRQFRIDQRTEQERFQRLHRKL